MASPSRQTEDAAGNAAEVPCTVYRCSARAEMYLYMRDDVTAECLPDGMLGRLGELQEVLRLRLHPQRTLARADVQQALRALREDGYYLQLPPPPDEAERIRD